MMVGLLKWALNKRDYEVVQEGWPEGPKRMALRKQRVSSNPKVEKMWAT